MNLASRPMHRNHIVMNAAKTTVPRRKRNLWPATGAFLYLLSMAVVFWFAWGMT